MSIQLDYFIKHDVNHLNLTSSLEPYTFHYIAWLRLSRLVILGFMDGGYFDRGLVKTYLL